MSRLELEKNFAVFVVRTIFPHGVTRDLFGCRYLREISDTDITEILKCDYSVIVYLKTARYQSFSKNSLLRTAINFKDGSSPAEQFDYSKYRYIQE
jgi:hypothetical protein